MAKIKKQLTKRFTVAVVIAAIIIFFMLGPDIIAN